MNEPLDTMLSERSQTQKVMCGVTPFTRNITVSKTMETKDRRGIASGSGRGWGVTVNWYRGDENVLELRRGDGYTALV